MDFSSLLLAASEPKMDPIQMFETVFAPCSKLIVLGVVFYCFIDVLIEWLKVKSRKGKANG